MHLEKVIRHFNHNLSGFLYSDELMRNRLKRSDDFYEKVFYKGAILYESNFERV